MATSMNDNLPEAQKPAHPTIVRDAFECSQAAECRRDAGGIPSRPRGPRRPEGERLSGEVLEGGSDWQSAAMAPLR